MKTISVFTVDDFTLTHRHVMNALDDARYEVHRCYSAKDCLHLLAAHTPDIFLVDIEMADINGFELCDKLKRNKKTSEIPVIFLSARCSDSSIETALQHGGSGFIAKPFVPTELVAEIERVLKPKTAES